MSLQFADFDADGFEDIVTATFEGHAFVVRGSAEGWHAPEHIKDAQGRNVVLSLFYDMEARQYDNADRSPEGVTNAGDHMVSTMAMDWDADGDFDLLLGAKGGRLYLQRNEGSNKSPKFTGVNELLEAGGEPFNVPGGLTAARIVDWDGDGLQDLVCGSFAGGAYLYRNVGSEKAPRYAKPSVLAAAADPMDPADTRRPRESTNNGDDGPTSAWYVDVVDYDADGQLDLLVGGHYQHVPELRTLTEDEAARLDVLDAAAKTLSTEMSAYRRAALAKVDALSEDEQDAARSAIYSTDEYEGIAAKSASVRAEIEELRPRSKRVSGVWLYRGLPRG